jgi:hypothetical protein
MQASSNLLLTCNRKDRTTAMVNQHALTNLTS